MENTLTGKLAEGRSWENRKPRMLSCRARNGSDFDWRAAEHALRHYHDRWSHLCRLTIVVVQHSTARSAMGNILPGNLETIQTVHLWSWKILEDDWRAAEHALRHYHDRWSHLCRLTIVVVQHSTARSAMGNILPGNLETIQTVHLWSWKILEDYHHLELQRPAMNVAKISGRFAVMNVCGFWPN